MHPSWLPTSAVDLSSDGLCARMVVYMSVCPCKCEVEGITLFKNISWFYRVSDLEETLEVMKEYILETLIPS